MPPTERSLTDDADAGSTLGRNPVGTPVTASATTAVRPAKPKCFAIGPPSNLPSNTKSVNFVTLASKSLSLGYSRVNTRRRRASDRMDTGPSVPPFGIKSSIATTDGGHPRRIRVGIVTEGVHQLGIGLRRRCIESTAAASVPLFKMKRSPSVGPTGRWPNHGTPNDIAAGTIQPRGDRSFNSSVAA